MRSIEEIFGTWSGACTNPSCAVCFDTKSPVYRKAACPTRTTEDKIVDAGEEFDYLGQRAEIMKIRDERRERTNAILAEIAQAKSEGKW